MIQTKKVNLNANNANIMQICILKICKLDKKVHLLLFKMLKFLLLCTRILKNITKKCMINANSNANSNAKLRIA